MSSAAGLTHIGKRPNNEDSYCICEIDYRTLLVVADGLGGYNAGEVASELAAKVLVENLREMVAIPDRKHILIKGIKKVNIAIYELAGKRSEYMHMGTTVVAALVDGNEVTVANVGDSRAYLIEDVGIRRITKDHSLVQSLLDKGDIDEDEAFNHPLRNVVLRSVGSEKSVICDLYELKLKERDILLLCSDGLSDSIRDVTIESVVKGSSDLDSAARDLIGTALSRGGQDNVTAVLYAHGC